MSICLFENQILDSENYSVRITKQLIGLAGFIKWINLFPEYNLKLAVQNEYVLSPYLSSFFCISKSDSLNTLYLGVQEKEARWLKFLPFFSANLDVQKKQLSLLCDCVSVATRNIPAINITLQIADGDWKINQLTQLRRLKFVGVRVESGEVIEILDYAQGSLKLYHQAVNMTLIQNTVNKQSSNSISSLF